MTLDAASFSILWPAFIAGLLVTATHVPLGMQVLARGIVFIDLAIAQIAGCGVLIADRIGFERVGAIRQMQIVRLRRSKWQHRYFKLVRLDVGVVGFS